jgi:hypothetical protein
MATSGLIRRDRYAFPSFARTSTGLIRRDENALADGEDDMEPATRRRAAGGHSAFARTAGVAGAAFTVGFAQGRFGTSKVGGLPAEIVAGGLLHATAGLPDLPDPMREALRALGDGALAAAALTFGHQVGARRG